MTKLPDALYKILLIEKEDAKRPLAPGTVLMNPLAVLDICDYGRSLVMEGTFVRGVK